MPLFLHRNINQDLTIAVWRISETYEQLFSELSEQNKVYFTENSTNNKRLNLQRLAAFHLLRKIHPEHFTAQQLMRSENGCPYLDTIDDFISISHCKDLVGIALNNKEKVGIDLEYPVQKILRIKHKFLNDWELDFINSKHELNQITACWSIKESIFKWHSIGKVEFREDIHIHPFLFEKEGFVQVNFMKEGFETSKLMQIMSVNNAILTFTIN